MENERQCRLSIVRQQFSLMLKHDITSAVLVCYDDTDDRALLPDEG